MCGFQADPVNVLLTHILSVYIWGHEFLQQNPGPQLA